MSYAMFSGMMPPATRAKISLWRTGCGEAPFTATYEPPTIKTITARTVSYLSVHGPSRVDIGLLENLFAGEALEVGHLPLHFFARGVGCGADALDAELELIGVRCAQQRFIE